MVQKSLKNPPFSLPALYKYIEGGLFSAGVFTVLLGVNVGQTSSLVLLPFSRRFFRLANRGFAYFWWNTCILTIRGLHKSELHFSGDELPMEENAILISNHQQMADIVMIMMLSKPKKRLGDLKWFVKDPLKYVPGIGWGMLFLDCLFVKRNWEADRDKIHSIFSKFKDHKIPIWLISFVEGTRITERKLKASQEYAKQKGLPILKNVLLPRTKGFVASVQGLREHATAVYDVTIGYPQGVPTLFQIASGAAKDFKIHVKRFEMKDLPEDSEKLARWLVERFEAKDELLSTFYKTGKFPAAQAEPKMQPLPSAPIPELVP